MGLLNLAVLPLLYYSYVAADVLHYETTPNGFNAPVRGWNSFGVGSYGDHSWVLNQANVLSQCSVLAEKNLTGLGYTYCSIDSGWSQGVIGDEYGRIVNNVTFFPDMKKLGDDLHDQGLKLGIYILVSDLLPYICFVIDLPFSLAHFKWIRRRLSTGRILSWKISCSPNTTTI